MEKKKKKKIRLQLAGDDNFSTPFFFRYFCYELIHFAKQREPPWF